MSHWMSFWSVVVLSCIFFITFRVKERRPNAIDTSLQNISPKCSTIALIRCVIRQVKWHQHQLNRGEKKEKGKRRNQGEQQNTARGWLVCHTPSQLFTCHRIWMGKSGLLVVVWLHFCATARVGHSTEKSFVVFSQLDLVPITFFSRTSSTGWLVGRLSCHNKKIKLFPGARPPYA